MNTEEPTYVDFVCPQCDNHISYEYFYIGSAQMCPNCTETVVIPETSNAVAKGLGLPLETARCLIRRLHPDDAYDLAEYWCDEEVIKSTGRWEYSHEDVLIYLEREDPGHQLGRPNDVLRVGIELAEESKVVGEVTLNFVDANHRILQFTVLIHPAYRNRGLAKETMKEIIVWGFTHLNLHRMEASTHSYNDYSIRVLEGLNMVREAVIRENVQSEDGWHDSIIYGLLKSDIT